MINAPTSGQAKQGKQSLVSTSDHLASKVTLLVYEPCKVETFFPFRRIVPRGEPALALFTRCAFSACLRKDHYLCLSCHAHFSVMTFMETKKIITSTCFQRRTESVAYAFWGRAPRASCPARACKRPAPCRAPVPGRGAASHRLPRSCPSFTVLSN